MNLKKIIKEETNDFEWIKDVKTKLDIAQEIYNDLEWHKQASTDFVNPQWNQITFSVRPDKTNKEKVLIHPNTFHKGFRKYMEERWGINSREEYLEIYGLIKGLMNQKVRKPINESFEDLEWIRDINVEDFNVRIGDKIRVHNIGDEKAFKRFLGLYAIRYESNTYGSFIEGEVTALDRDRFFNLHVEHVDDDNEYSDIWFPTYKQQSLYNDGLSLLYELI